MVMNDYDRHLIDNLHHNSLDYVVIVTYYMPHCVITAIDLPDVNALH